MLSPLGRYVLGLDGKHIAMTTDEYMALETALLTAVLAELRCLYGDL